MSQKRLNLNNLIYIADRLDKLGYYAKASHIDNCIRKLASGQGDAEEILGKVRDIVSGVSDEAINKKLESLGHSEEYINNKKDPIYVYKKQKNNLEEDIKKAPDGSDRKGKLQAYLDLATLNFFEALDDLGLIEENKLSAEEKKEINQIREGLTPPLEIRGDDPADKEEETTEVIDFGWL